MKILVPIDFSDRSKKALQVADKFAQLFDGKITPFYSHLPISELDEPYALGMSSKIYQNFENLEEQLTNRVKEVAENNVDPSRLDKPSVVLGNAAEGIIDASEGYDYIIMSSHGRTGFSRFLLGSVAEKVLRLAHTPVMVVENESEVDDFKKIMVTTDFSDNAAEAYPYAIDIAERSGAKVDLVHVLSFEQFDEEEKDLSLRKIREERLKLLEKEHFGRISNQVNHEVIVSQDSVHEAIFNHVQNNEYNLIIMATVGRTGINYLMMGSTTANVVRHVNTAVLSVNPKKD
ncbi:universal stress protein [Rhodohalobacter sp. 614A]|uniref:universal stress protein n=1 Tax=Rhodohalobacter sp. 614A TaxID=2908649 RepID=UPI001F2B0CC1|nr:universal stress protein [Rhodohalobacter sp. 614A]